MASCARCASTCEREVLCRCSTATREIARQLEISRRASSSARSRSSPASSDRVSNSRSRAEPRPGRDDVLQRRTVLPLQTLDQRQSILDLLKPPRRRIDVVGVATQQEGHVFELRLDALPRVQLLGKLRLDRRKLSDPFPDLRQPGEHGVIAVVERRVRLLTQPLDPLGVGEHLLRGREFLVLAGLQRRLSRSLPAGTR